MSEMREPPADQSWLEMEGVKPDCFLTFTGKLTDEEAAVFRKRFEEAKLRPTSLLGDGVVIRRSPWWVRMWREMRGKR